MENSVKDCYNGKFSHQVLCFYLFTNPESKIKSPQSTRFMPEMPKVISGRMPDDASQSHRFKTSKSIFSEDGVCLQQVIVDNGTITITIHPRDCAIQYTNSQGHPKVIRGYMTYIDEKHVRFDSDENPCFWITCAI